MLRPILKSIQVVYTVYAFACFVAIMLVLFPFIALASLFGKIKGGNIIYKIATFWADLWLLLIGIHHKTINEKLYDNSGHYILVCNHISYMDIPVMLKTFRRFKIRVMGKYELSRIPVFGFIYRNAAVLVKRDDPEHRRKGLKTLLSILNKNISVFIYAEGTFNETNQPLAPFYNGAFRLAVDTQTPILPVVFLDTYRRLNYKSIFSLSPGRSRAVILQPINASGLTSADVPALKARVYRAMEETLIRYKAEWIKSPATAK
jgi:1-acyl-sn-glycerol-3-phosphate acyltransferase